MIMPFNSPLNLNKYLKIRAQKFKLARRDCHVYYYVTSTIGFKVHNIDINGSATAERQTAARMESRNCSNEEKCLLLYV